MPLKDLMTEDFKEALIKNGVELPDPEVYPKQFEYQIRLNHYAHTLASKGKETTND